MHCKYITYLVICLKIYCIIKYSFTLTKVSKNKSGFKKHFTLILCSDYFFLTTTSVPKYMHISHFEESITSKFDQVYTKKH